MRSLKKLRFAGIGMVFGTAGMLASSALHAANPTCATPAATCCTPTASAPQCCDHIYEEAARKLAALNHGCAPAGAPACAPVYAPAPTCGVPAASACDSVCNPDAVFGCTSDGGCEEPGPWRLSEEEGFSWGGWVNMGYQNNPDGSFTGNGTALNQKEWDKFNLNQLYIYAEKVADGEKGVDWGFRFDAMYGVDGNEGQAFGNINPGYWDYANGFDHGIYEIALPQAYGEVAVGDLSVKLGHFYTLIGYESVMAPSNFFASRQLTFYHSEPFTHTGALGAYKVNDKLTVNGGWTLGMDTGFYQFAGGNSFLGGFSYAVNDRTTFSYYTTFGDLGWRGNGAINSVILSTNWTDKFTTVTQFDVLGSDLGTDFAAGGGTPPGDSTGWINYAFYQLTDLLKAGVRTEWYKADGTSYQTLTYGVNITPTQNITVRPEVRHMWSPGNNTKLFNDTVVGVDAIITF